MKQVFVFVIFTFLVLFSGCETEDELTQCYPQRIKRTISEGINASSLTADFKYIDDQLDRIVWSNYQTHFYFYDSEGLLEKISRRNQQTFEILESWLFYEDDILSRTDEYRISLDRFTQQESDTFYTGYHEFQYIDANLIYEGIYIKNDTSQLVSLASYKEYDYDLSGNLTKHLWINEILGDTVEAFSYIYDDKRHPLSSLNLNFEGISYVNNVLEHIDLLKDDIYSYQILYSPIDFPIQINIKQGSFFTEFITIDYTCN